MALTDEQIAEAVQFALGRAPAGAAEIATLRETHADAKALAKAIFLSSEFQQRVAGLARESGAAIDEFTRRRIVFLHIPKTAGTTVRQALYGNFGSADTFPDTNWIGHYPANVISKYRLFAGHFTMHDIEHVPAPKHVFTILREPRQRIVSYYRYRRARDAGKPVAGADPLGARLSLPLKDFLRDPVVRTAKTIFNTQARFLYCIRGDVGRTRVRRFGMDRAFTLDNILANLSSLDGVGLVEELDAFMARYFARMQLKIPKGLRRSNVTDDLAASAATREPRPPLDDETNALLDELVEFDEPLYAHAQKLVADAVASAPAATAQHAAG